MFKPQQWKHVFCRHCQSQFETYEQLVNHIEQYHPLNQTGGRQETKSKQLYEDEWDNPGDNNQSGVLKNGTIKENSNLYQHDAESALRNAVENRYIHPRLNERYDFLPFLANSRDEIINYLRTRARQLGGIKSNLCVQIEMQRNDGHELTTSTPYFRKSNLSLFLL